MKTFPLRRVLGTNRFLNGKLPIVHVILNALRGDDDRLVELNDDMEVQASHAVVLWILSHIVPRGVISQDTMVALITTFPKTFVNMGTWCANALERGEDVKPMIIGISDRRLVQLPMTGQWYDTMRCVPVKYEPKTFEGITYNVARPAELEWARIHMEQQNEPSRQGQGSPAGPGNTSQRAVDSIGRPIGSGDAAMGPDDNQAGTQGETRPGAGPQNYQSPYDSD